VFCPSFEARPGEQKLTSCIDEVGDKIMLVSERCSGMGIRDFGYGTWFVVGVCVFSMPRAGDGIEENRLGH
jgi:hypothetical protein